MITLDVILSALFSAPQSNEGFFYIVRANTKLMTNFLLPEH
jgi:hypothetical protein